MPCLLCQFFNDVCTPLLLEFYRVNRNVSSQVAVAVGALGVVVPFVKESGQVAGGGIEMAGAHSWVVVDGPAGNTLEPVPCLDVEGERIPSDGVFEFLCGVDEFYRFGFDLPESSLGGGVAGSMS